MHNEFNPYKEDEPIFITIKRSKGYMPSVWSGIFAVIILIVAFSTVVVLIGDWLL